MNEALLESLLDAIWIVDAKDLRVLQVNEAAVRLSRLPRAALLGRGVTSLVATPEDLAFWADAHAGRDDRLWSESLVRCGEGEVVPVTRRVSAIEDEGGRRVYVVAMQERTARVM